jgi:hypothetical protein
MASYSLTNTLRSMPMIFAAFSICLSLTLFLSETRAQPVKLTVSYTGVGPINLPVVLAKEPGIFARNGLDVGHDVWPTVVYFFPSFSRSAAFCTKDASREPEASRFLMPWGLKRSWKPVIMLSIPACHGSGRPSMASYCL